LEDVLDIVAADAKYGNAKFLRPLQEQNCTSSKVSDSF